VTCGRAGRSQTEDLSGQANAFAPGAAFALVGQTLRDTLNQTILDSLVTPVGDVDRLFTRGIRVSLDNDTTRVNTAWVNENVMAGGQQVAELYNRGSQFTPMILHWKSGNTTMPSRPYVSFFQLYATASTINATVTPWHIEVSYPNNTQAGTDVFEYLIGDIPAPFWAAGQNVSTTSTVVITEHNDRLFASESVLLISAR
jgi:hypothetical protein